MERVSGVMVVRPFRIVWVVLVTFGGASGCGAEDGFNGPHSGPCEAVYEENGQRERLSRWSYDNKGRKVRWEYERAADGVVTSWAEWWYRSDDQPSRSEESVDGGPPTTAFVHLYDDDGLPLRRETRALPSESVVAVRDYVYDDNGFHIRTDFDSNYSGTRNGHWDFENDAEGNRTREVYFENDVEKFYKNSTYNEAGQLIATESAWTGSRAQFVSFKYDSEGNLERESDNFGEVTEYEYDSRGNQLKSTRFEDGRLDWERYFSYDCW